MTSGDLSTFAFVFDMNLLFERFIAGFIRRYASHILPEAFLRYELLPQSHGARRYLASRENRSVFQTIPDIAFRNRDLFPLLIDTKYKLLDDKERNVGVSQSDFYQMHAYAHRYNCDRIILLYPNKSSSSERIHATFKLADCEKVIEASSVNVSVNLANSEGRCRLISELRQMFPQETSS